MRRKSTTLVLPLLLGLILGCSKSEAPPPPAKTKAQRDSAVANSGLPGAQGVAMAMKAADSAKARQAAIDSAGKP